MSSAANRKEIMTTAPATTDTDTDAWLTRYYFTRAVFSLAWVGAAVSLAHSGGAVVAALLLIYPAWDAGANIVDAQRHGGFRRNPTQTFNAAVSVVTTLSVAVALSTGMNAVLGVFGVWAALSGLLQLATGARRWRTHGGQWPMIVSGIQSTAAGIMFLLQATGPGTPQITDIAPYAGFGAFYFLIAAVWLTVRTVRARA